MNAEHRCERPALRSVAAALLAALLGSAMPGALAQQATPGAATSASFTLRGVMLRGNNVLGDEATRLAAPYIGRETTLAALEKLAAEITQAYRERGYFLAQALVPQQQVKDGIVEISVLEGRLGKVKLSVAADAPIGEARILAILAKLPVGAPLQQSRYERTMLLLSDLPGLHVQSGLEQGAQTGTTDLVVEVTPAARRWQASADFDNHGTEVSGRERASISARYASPLAIGDNLDARLMRTFSGHQTFGRISYELPLNADGLRGGIGYSRVGYELGAQFAALGATGTADVGDVSLVYPLLRSRTRNLFVRAAYESKALSDTTESVGLDSDKRVDVVSVALNWEARDALLGGGYTSGGLTVSRGKLRIRDAVTSELDQSDFGYHSAGPFTKVALQASRLQALFGRHNLYASLLGQWTNRNLDASEKLALGGERAVRAYPSGEVLVDSGWVGSIEWRYSASEDLVAALFFDAAHGKQWRDPLPTDTRNTRTLRGTGIGLTWTPPYYGISVQGALAWRHGDAPVSESSNDNPRLLLQVRKTF